MVKPPPILQKIFYEQWLPWAPASVFTLLCKFFSFSLSSPLFVLLLTCSVGFLSFAGQRQTFCWLGCPFNCVQGQFCGLEVLEPQLCQKLLGIVPRFHSHQDVISLAIPILGIYIVIVHPNFGQTVSLHVICHLFSDFLTSFPSLPKHFQMYSPARVLPRPAHHPWRRPQGGGDHQLWTNEDKRLARDRGCHAGEPLNIHT